MVKVISKKTLNTKNCTTLNLFFLLLKTQKQNQTTALTLPVPRVLIFTYLNAN